MSSLFDSEVYAARERIPWAEVSVEAFMSDAAANGEVKLEVFSRPSVSSRLWWSITWTDCDGKERGVSSQSLHLCLWRAAVVERRQLQKMRQRVKEMARWPDADYEI